MSKIEKSYWDIGLENYMKFIDEHGHPFVPVRQEGKTSVDDGDGFKAYTYGTGRDGKPFLLGRWVAYARRVMKNHLKKPTPISVKRKSDLEKCGFMYETDIRQLLIGDIKENAYKIDAFIKQVSVIISKKLKGKHNELSLERYFWREMSEEVHDFDDEIEPAHEYKFPDSKRDELSQKLKDYQIAIIGLENAQIQIKKIKSDIRSILSSPERYYVEDPS